MPKKRTLGQFAGLRRGLGKIHRDSVFFLGIDTLMHTKVPNLKDCKIPISIYNNNISETILIMLALTVSYKTMKLS